MRFAHFAALASFSFVALTTFGCSEDPPEPAQGAFTVFFVQPNAVDCQDAGHNGRAGDVNTTTANEKLTNGVSDAEIDCTVKGSGDSFSVEASISHNGNALAIAIAGISPKATEEKPAKGSISYASTGTSGQAYRSEGATCNFYFVGGKQTVDAGKIWVTFACEEVTRGGESTCNIQQGMAIFEHCVGSPGNEVEEEEE